MQHWNDGVEFLEKAFNMLRSPGTSRDLGQKSGRRAIDTPTGAFCYSWSVAGRTHAATKSISDISTAGGTDSQAWIDQRLASGQCQQSLRVRGLRRLVLDRMASLDVPFTQVTNGAGEQPAKSDIVPQLG